MQSLARSSGNRFVSLFAIGLCGLLILLAGSCKENKTSPARMLQICQETLLRVARESGESDEDLREKGFLIPRLLKTADLLKDRRTLAEPMLIWAYIELKSGESRASEGHLFLNWVEGEKHAVGIILETATGKRSTIELFSVPWRNEFISYSWTINRVRVTISDKDEPCTCQVNPTIDRPMPLMLVLPRSWIQAGIKIGIYDEDGNESNLDSPIILEVGATETKYSVGGGSGRL